MFSSTVRPTLAQVLGPWAGVACLNTVVVASVMHGVPAAASAIAGLGICGLGAYLTCSLYQRYDQLLQVGDLDNLSGLLNRDAFVARLSDTLEAEDDVTLLFMDLNKFKVVNDSLGHRAGDELLRRAADRIKNVMASMKCAVARMGGDEFAIALVATSSRDVEKLAHKLSEAFFPAFELSSGAVEVGVSIGIANYPTQADNPTDLTRFADLAMYEAKRTNQPYVFFNPQLAHASEEEMYMSSTLRVALERGQLEVEYQPKYSLLEDRIVGAEALVRWNHPVYGRILPDRFIPLAEHMGLINPITDWVLTRALHDLKYAKDLGLPLDSISVNISPFSVVNGNLLLTISKALASSSSSPESLIVEVTETSIQHRSEALIKVLMCLDVMGIGISIDDFGTGQSSLLYLKFLPTTEIKIDRSFIKNICTNPQDLAIVRALVSLAHNIGCTVCAEGVETTEVRDALKELGCDLIQGHLIAKSAPIESLVREFGNHV